MKHQFKNHIKIYNQMRPHTSLEYQTPDELHRAYG
ncbi:integrase core domain-containing protein [Vibrio artabrorum]